MQLQDMVKLIYQNEFAGGHMIADEKESLKRLEDEFEAIKKTGQIKQFFQLLKTSEMAFIGFI